MKNKIIIEKNNNEVIKFDYTHLKPINKIVCKSYIAFVHDETMNVFSYCIRSKTILIQLENKQIFLIKGFFEFMIVKDDS